MTGDVSLALNGKRPKIVGNLAAAKIDLKDFGVKPAGGASGGSSGSGGGRVFPNDPLPFAGLTAVGGPSEKVAEAMRFDN